MRRPLLVLGLAAACLSLDCRNLPTIASDTCGNAVVDPPLEDCDTFPVGVGTFCRPPGQKGACRLDCTPKTGHVCPDGWGCGVDSICRAPSGNFSRASTPVAADAWRLATGDFDGDGYADVFVRAATDPFGASKARIEYYEPQADHKLALADTLVLGPKIGSPVLLDFDGDLLTDVAFTLPETVLGGIDVMRGSGDRTLAPVAYPAFSIPTQVAMARVHVYDASDSDVPVILYGQQGQAGLSYLGATSVMTTSFATPSGPPSALVAPMLGARFVEAPGKEACDQVVLVYADHADVYSPCKFDASGNAVQNDGAVPTTVHVPGNSLSGAAVGDVDGDGHLDLMLGDATASSLSGATVAYGNGAGAFHADDGTPGVAHRLKISWTYTPPEVPEGGADGGAVDAGMLPAPVGFRCPVAAGDVNGDGRADFVSPDYIFVSIPGLPEYYASQHKTQGQWTDARIADMNGDGLPDVVAITANALDADFYLGTGGLALDPFSLPTSGRVSQVEVGDFDGDRITDVAIVETASDPAMPADVAIGWGQSREPPLAPTPVGQFDGATQIVSLRRSLTTLADMAVLAVPAQSSSTNVSVLLGSGDRQPLAPYILSDPQNQVDVNALGIVAGPFLSAGARDIVAVGEDFDSKTLTQVDFRYWLAPGGKPPPALGAAVSSMPLDAQFKPIYGIALNMPRLDMLMAAGDLAATGTYSAVAVAPLGLETMSALVPAAAVAGPAIAAAQPLQIPVRVSPDGQFEFHDVDADGKPDAVLLTGSNIDMTRTLLVAFNEGGTPPMFQSANPLVVNAGGEVPQGFALVNVDLTGPPRIAYVTRTSVVLAKVDPAMRAIVDRTTIDMPTTASGVASGDIDGDGVQDLVIADGGNVIVLRDAPVNE